MRAKTFKIVGIAAFVLIAFMAYCVLASNRDDAAILASRNVEPQAQSISNALTYDDMIVGTWSVNTQPDYLWEFFRNGVLNNYLKEMQRPMTSSFYLKGRNIYVTGPVDNGPTKYEIVAIDRVRMVMQKEGQPVRVILTRIK